MRCILYKIYHYFFLSWISLSCSAVYSEGLPLFYWNEDPKSNFGDYLSKILVERIVETPLDCYVKKSKNQRKKLLAVGSILYFALTGDVVWGSGINGKVLDKNAYQFTNLDIRAVRGPMTRQFIMDQFHIPCPEIYGDPALLFPYFFPEFKRKKEPSIEYLIIPHYTDLPLFPKDQYKHIVYPSDPWEEILENILDSRLVIASSLHGIVLAEAYGIPARALRMSNNAHNHMFKYYDYYFGTNRHNFQFAYSVDEALHMGGEPPIQCDLETLFNAFPFEFWPNTNFKHPNFKTPLVNNEKNTF